MKENRNNKGKFLGRGRTLFLLLSFGFAVTLSSGTAQACGECSCVTQSHKLLRKLIKSENESTRDHITQEFKNNQVWIVDTFFREYALPAMMMMTEQLTTVGMQQTMIIGSFFDAKQQLETQRLLQIKTAQAHKDYQPSTEMCTIGSTARSLAASDRTGEYATFVLGQRSQSRQLGNINSNAAQGPKEDREGRLALFKNRFCDTRDLNNKLGPVCGATNGNRGPTLNKDIDYTRLIGNNRTINIDFAEGAVDEESDEPDLLAMGSNLFAHDVFTRPRDTVLMANDGANQDDYYELRTVVAKRSVAENSFNAIAGMKTAGTEDAINTGLFASAVFKQLGVSEEEAIALLGERPSYYALLEILTQKIYQNPVFFTNLYDKPANIARKDVAIQAIDLMLDRDMYKSELRYEAMLAVLLELETSKLQEAVQNRLNWLTEGGKPGESQGEGGGF